MIDIYILIGMFLVVVFYLLKWVIEFIFFCLEDKEYEGRSMNGGGG